MMIPVNIGQFQFKYRSVAVELSIRNLPSLVKFVFGLKCGLSIGWVIITREDEPPYPPSLLQHSVIAQLQLSSTPNQLPEFHSIKEITVVCSGVTLSPDLGI